VGLVVGLSVFITNLCESCFWLWSFSGWVFHGGVYA
jgi:hypothetical protein